MDEPPERERAVGRALKLSVVDAMLHAIMVGAGESFLGALAVELGHADTSLAILITVPMLAGAGAQLGASSLTRILGSRKRLVVVAVVVQALANAGFIAIAALEVRALAPLLVAKILFWCAGLVGAPAWGAWMADLTAGIDRGRFLSWRQSAAQLSLLVGFLGAGASLHAERSLATFAGLYLAALIARAASAVTLAAQPDPDAPPPSRRPLLSALRAAARSSRKEPPLLIALLMLGAFLSVPFYTPYMLRELGLDFGTYTALTAVPIVVRAASAPLLHRLTGRLGLRAVMLGSGAGIAVVAALWSASGRLDVLIAAQVLSGLCWGAFELSSFQLLIDCADEEHRVELLSLSACLSGVAQLVGAIGGGLLLTHAGLSYREIFLASAVARALPLLVLARHVPDVARATPRLFMRLVSVRPSGGTTERPIVWPRGWRPSAAPRQGGGRPS